MRQVYTPNQQSFSQKLITSALLGVSLTALTAETIELPIIAYSASNYQEGNPPANAFDNLLDTRWSSDETDASLTLTLEQEAVLESISLATFVGDTRVTYFDIESSLDGETWTALGSFQTSATTLEQESYPLPQVTAKFVKLIGKGNSNSAWNSYTEIDLLGSIPINEEQLEIVSATATHGTKHPAENMLDGDLTSRWTTGTKGASATFTLAEVSQINYANIALYKGDIRSTTFDLEASIDGENWTFLGSYVSSGDTTENVIYEFDDTYASQIRLTTFGNSITKWNTFSEFAVVGSVINNDAPVITAGDSISQNINTNNTPNAFSLILDADDANGDALTWAISSLPENGSASVAANGVVAYTPAQDYEGNDSFTVSVTDPLGASDSIVVNVIVAAYTGDLELTVDTTDFLGAQPASGQLSNLYLGGAPASADQVSLSGPNADLFKVSNGSIIVDPAADLPTGQYDLTLTNNSNPSNTLEITIQLVAETQLSALWGFAGELWDSSSRLPWFGHSGYQFGGVAIPVGQPATHNVLDFGAIANDGLDDSDAFELALEAAAGGVLYVPAGTYEITKQLYITSSNSVLRGAGQGETILSFPLNLEEATGEAAGTFTYRGGFITVLGEHLHYGDYTLLGEAARGSYSFELSDVSELAVGDYLRIRQAGSEALALHLHGDNPSINPESDNETVEVLTDFIAEIESINGTTVTLDRPSRTDIKPEWIHSINKWEPTVEQVGLESMTLKMSGEDHESHNSETGNNAIVLQSIAHSWVYDLEILDSDNALQYYDTRFTTAIDCEIGVETRGLSDAGHHGVWFIYWSQDNLVENVNIYGKWVHALSVESYSNGNVMHDCYFDRLEQDHHMWAPYANLFTNLHTQDASRIWQCGGARNKPRGTNAAARPTSWNISYDGSSLMNLPSATEFPMQNVVGILGYTEAILDATDTSTTERWVESMENVYPQDLYQAQLEKRFNNN
ncbi:discoidin domain-containing protein [Persicirhabdus sediminis]|uniref:Discoidin domain-containing protein n=1 Tax=Persicirhabdus sediminis TaxID=454144 RepID=A0A8J7MH23_9BACT|nr:discoidin domain-containing protein [Persicirhabdus sediminis]